MEEIDKKIEEYYDRSNSLMMTREQFSKMIHHFLDLQEQQFLKDGIPTTVTESYGAEKVDGKWTNTTKPTVQVWPSREKFDYGDKVTVVLIKNGNKSGD